MDKIWQRWLFIIGYNYIDAPCYMCYLCITVILQQLTSPVVIKLRNVLGKNIGKTKQKQLAVPAYRCNIAKTRIFTYLLYMFNRRQKNRQRD